MAQYQNNMRLIREIKSMLDENSRRGLKEAFSLPEDDEFDFGGDYGTPDGNPGQQPAPEQQPTNGGKPMNGDGDIESILTQIRVLSLEGIRMLAQTPEDPNYEVLKKIWTFVDKTTIDKQKEMGSDQAK